jgi:hypothetical protein
MWDYLDAIARAIGYFVMAAGGVLFAGKMMAGAAWCMFENIKSTGRLVDYTLFRQERRNQRPVSMDGKEG